MTLSNEHFRLLRGIVQDEYDKLINDERRVGQNNDLIEITRLRNRIVSRLEKERGDANDQPGSNHNKKPRQDTT